MAWPQRPSRRADSDGLADRLRSYLSVLKLGITAANLMATFAGLWVGAHGRPSFWTGLWTMVGTACVVAAGAALNNFIDRDIDSYMERTRTRAVAAGRVRPELVLWLGIGLGVLGIVMLAWLVNLAAAACAFVGLLVYALVYSVWLKRTTTLSTVLGGLAGAMPPLIGFAGGSGGSINVAAWVIFFVFFLWQPPHFLPLAMRRSEEYRAAGIPMLPVVRGFTETKWQILLYTAAMVPVSLLLYPLHYEGPLYLLLAVVLGLWFLVKAGQGLFVQDDIAWAKGVFRVSLVYLTGFCLALVLGTL
ncbi:MAG: heme o synthase [Alicyclobacillus sp.]|nr:heme o synthase [Alicyclobacillus sp.]